MYCAGSQRNPFELADRRFPVIDFVKTRHGHGPGRRGVLYKHGHCHVTKAYEHESLPLY